MPIRIASVVSDIHLGGERKVTESGRAEATRRERPIAESGLDQPIPEIRSEELFQGTRELRIRHGGHVYRLLITRNNKLILQK